MGMKPRRTGASVELEAQRAEAQKEVQRMAGAFDILKVGPWLLEARIAPSMDSRKTVRAAQIGRCTFKLNRDGTKTVTLQLHYQDDGGHTL